MLCPSCGNQAQDSAVFCDQCGTRLSEPESEQPTTVDTQVATQTAGVNCSSCSYTNVPGELFCENCGAALEALEPEPVETAEDATPAHNQAVQASTESVVLDQPADPAPASEPVVEPPTSTVDPTPVETAPAPVPAMEEAPASSAQDLDTCAACGTTAMPDDEFCDNCGAALKQVVMTPLESEALTAPEAPADNVNGSPKPRFVVVDTGAEIPLPSGSEILIGREDPVSGVFPEIDLTPHGGEEGGVSRKHMRLKFHDGSYLAEDLNSTNFTMLNQQRLAPHAPQAINDGDEIRLGRVRLQLLVN